MRFTAVLAVLTGFIFGCKNHELSLYEMVERGETNQLKKLLQTGMDPNKILPEGRTLLQAAVGPGGNLNVTKNIIRIWSGS